MYRLFIVGLLIGLLWGCDPIVSRLYITNKSGNTIIFFMGDDSLYGMPAEYFSKPNEYFPFIQNGTTYQLPCIGEWETIIITEYPDSSFFLFFIDSTALKIADKDSLRKHIVRYHVKLCDLKKNNWVIEYK